MDILLLKESKGLDDPYYLALKDLGSVHFIPVLSIKMVNNERLQDLLWEGNFTNIIFTSGNAVKAVKLAIESSETESESNLMQIQCYVVGKATQKLANELGFTCRGSTTGNAEDLARLIIEESSACRNETYLFPCGQMKRETLPSLLNEAGLNLTSVTVYETSENPDILEEISRCRRETKQLTIAVFYSPSGVKFSLSKLKALYEEDLRCAAIGKTTAEALQKNGIAPCCIAECPTPEDLGHAIESCMGLRKND